MIHRRPTTLSRERVTWQPLFGRMACASMVFSLLLGCGSDAVLSPPTNTDPTTIFYAVRLNHNVVNLTPAPYDTITLVATPYSAVGTVLPDTNATVQFISRDTLAIGVTADGHVTPRKTGIAAWIVASVTIGNVTLYDSARVVRLATIPVITGLSAAPVPPDSAVVRNWRSGQVKNTTVQLSGTDLSGVLVQFEVPDVAVAYIQTRFGASGIGHSNVVAAATDGRATAKVGGVNVGQRMIRVSTMVRGVIWVDSVLFTVGMTPSVSYSIRERQRIDGTVVYSVDPDTAYIPLGGTAGWGNGSRTQPMSIIFEDSSKALPANLSWVVEDGGGNITPWVYDPSNYLSGGRARRFVAPDTIRWHSPERSVSGTLIVVDDWACLPDNCPPFSRESR